MNKAFAALRVFGAMLKVLAWIGLILGLILAIVALVLGFLAPPALDIPWLSKSTELAGVVAFLAVLVLSALFFLVCYAAGEFTSLMLSIEENSRRTAYILQQQYLVGPEAYLGPQPASAEIEGAAQPDTGS